MSSEQDATKELNVYHNEHDWWIGESAEAVERQYEHETGATSEEYPGWTEVPDDKRFAIADTDRSWRLQDFPDHAEIYAEDNMIFVRMTIRQWIEFYGEPGMLATVEY